MQNAKKLKSFANSELDVPILDVGYKQKGIDSRGAVQQLDFWGS